MLGLVFTRIEEDSERKELRDLEAPQLGRRGRPQDELQVGGQGGGSGDVEQDCLSEAIGKVEEERQMEGVFEVEGTGRVGFLVYRVD